MLDTVNVNVLPNTFHDFCVIPSVAGSNTLKVNSNGASILAILYYIKLLHLVRRQYTLTDDAVQTAISFIENINNLMIISNGHQFIV